MCRIVRSCGLRLFFTAAVYLATLQLKYRGVSPSEGRVGDHLGRVSYPEFVFLTTILAGERCPPPFRSCASHSHSCVHEWVADWLFYGELCVLGDVCQCRWSTWLSPS